jgi:sugar-phosphatase
MGWSPTSTGCDVHGVLFDMDGTLVDSTPVVEFLWGEFAARYGIDLAPLLRYAHGRQSHDTIQEFAPPGVDPAAATAEFERRELTCMTGIAEIAGARQLLAAIGDAHIAVVTSAPRALAVARLTAAGLSIPTVLVTSEDVPRGKPDPAGYTLAAARFPGRSAGCLAIEDAQAGIQAAIASGARTLVLGSHRSPATRHLPRVPDLTVIHATRHADHRVHLRWPHPAA